MERKTEEEILVYWENSGLIWGLDNRMKRHTSVILEKIKVYLDIERINIQYWDDELELLIYPIARRICSVINSDTEYIKCDGEKSVEEHKDLILEGLTPGFLILKLVDIYLPCLQYIRALTSGRKIDIQAETCARLAQDIGDRIVIDYYSDNQSPIRKNKG
jgi:hypothetical protein